MNLPKVIYIMGAPGGGKGTQAELLAQVKGYVRFSTGTAFRQVASQPTELGRQVKEIIENGYLAPPTMAAEIVKAAITKNIEAGEKLVFDGTPRTQDEAEVVDRFWQTQGYGQPLVIYLNIDKNEMIRRNSQRRFCLGIHNEFAVRDAADEEKCHNLGGQVGIRVDDSDEEKLNTRWNEFEVRTLHVIENYRQRGLVREVDGRQSIAKIHQDILNLLRNGAS